MWADYNGDGMPDLLLATAAGPAAVHQPRQGPVPRRQPSAAAGSRLQPDRAAWIDYDGDGKPDLLLGNGFHGLRLYRNKGKADPLPAPTRRANPRRSRRPTAGSRTFPATVGLGPDGIGGSVKGDTLTVCDVDGDGRPDFLYGAGNGLLVLNTPKGFVEAKDSGIAYKAGKVGPVFGDFDNDGHPDLFVPQPGGCKLFQNDGKGHFTDVTDKAGDLAKFTGHATCAAWGDLDNDGHLDLVVGCLKGPQPLLPQQGRRHLRGRHRGGRPEPAHLQHAGGQPGRSEQRRHARRGLQQRGPGIVRAAGQPRVPGRQARPVTLNVAGKDGVIGSRVSVLDKDGQVQGTQHISGGDGRGGQAAPQARFALEPGNYRVEVRYSSGVRRMKEITVASSPVRGVIDEQTPKME